MIYNLLIDGSELSKTIDRYGMPSIIKQMEEEVKAMDNENAFMQEYHSSTSDKLYFGFLEDAIVEMAHFQTT